ncbi:MAG: hypothetical protein NTY77_03640 [Elusimicrobia bacterium]|nr:hypothetical protein [Elusimicrobiota bacterium]
MRAFVLAVLLCPAAAAPVKQLADFAGVAKVQAQEGWTVRRTEGNDPALRLSLGSDIISARLFGGEGSRYLGLHDYLKGFEATTMGSPPERVREATVGGLRVWFYRHGYPINLGDPDTARAGPPELAAEEFCILPVGRRFLVLSWAHESPVPDPEDSGEAAWREFLSDFSLIKK